jgi:D-tyrosyl-tRNA(Tyr) deacylase
MRAVVQRVSQASVAVAGNLLAAINDGLLVYLGVDREDSETDAAYIAHKVRNLRIFPDDSGKMNRSVADTAGAVLMVSAFTVSADARKGHRPTFDSACEPERARALYEQVCKALRDSGVPVEQGSFGNEMQVASTNAGPICILVDSKRSF